MYRVKDKYKEYLLVKPGGPFYRNQNYGIWSFPKGIRKDGEDELEAAKREFKEETGQDVIGDPVFIGRIKLRKSKEIVIYSVEGSINAKEIKSNTFEMEYPKHSGEYHTFPEIEKGGWFLFEEAKKLVHPKLITFLEKVK